MIVTGGVKRIPIFCQKLSRIDKYGRIYIPVLIREFFRDLLIHDEAELSFNCIVRYEVGLKLFGVVLANPFIPRSMVSIRTRSGL